jgi:hypothetical protein
MLQEIELTKNKELSAMIFLLPSHSEGNFYNKAYMGNTVH